MSPLELGALQKRVEWLKPMMTCEVRAKDLAWLIAEAKRAQVLEEQLKLFEAAARGERP